MELSIMNELFISEQAINKAGQIVYVKVFFNYEKLKEALEFNLLPSIISIEVYLVDKNRFRDSLFAQMILKESSTSATIKIIDLISSCESFGNASIMLDYLLKTMTKTEEFLSRDGYNIRLDRIYGTLSNMDKEQNWKKSVPFYQNFVFKNLINPTTKYNLTFNLYYNGQKSTIEDFIKTAETGYFEYLVTEKKNHFP